ncbi:antiviral innate immune response receptor RIG-I-like isoform X2 [Ptychodera flava]|uniref:antiviral innate immune response receptor RIG-I-like isoform X2 n=1 Tax=Ptychodera flava TaxID=63121 RepID=UPI003969FDB5
MCDTDTKYTALESEQQQALLKVFEPLLKVRLIPTTMLLHLTEMFTIEEIIDIRNEELQKGRATAVHSLVERLLRKSEDYPDWFRVFMDALRYSDNGHIAEIIEGTCVSSMDELENYKRHIELFAPHLEVINPAEILPELTSILSDHDREQIKADQRNHGPRDAVLTLLDRLVKKTGDWFKDFLQALRSVGRDDLANLLHPQATQGAVYQQQDDLVTNTGGGRSDDNRVESGQQSLSPDRPPAQAVDSGQRAIQDGDVPSESPTTVPDESKVSPRGEACVNGSADYSDNGEPTAIPLESAEQLFESKPAAAVENVDVPVQSEKVTPVSNLDEGDTTHEEFNAGQGTTELLNTDVIEEKSDREYKEKPSQQSEGAIGEDKIDNDQLKARAINLRAYQTELVEPAFNGKNVILFAPTGSGKTVMAVAVMQYHLQEHNTGTRKKRVMFLVNQRPLVEQQERVFKHYLEPLGYRIIQLTGETLTYSLNQVVEARYDVIVLTAQILENALEDGDIKSLSVFTMLIFDECHHTQGKTSFNRIMGRYRDMKLERPEEPRPQIIGLTASIGVGKAANESGARDHILQICANLDVEMISKVVEYKNELSKYSPLPHEDILGTPGRQNDTFGKELNEIMSIIETEMESSKGVKEHKDLLKETEKRPIERGSLLYEQWLVKLCKHAIVLLDDKNVRRFFTTCSDHLREYNNACSFTKT